METEVWWEPRIMEQPPGAHANEHFTLNFLLEVNAGVQKKVLAFRSSGVVKDDFCLRRSLFCSPG